MNAATLVLAAGAAGLTLLAAGLLMHFRAYLPLAVPNARTLHAAPVPRVGGLAVWAGFVPLAWLAPGVAPMVPAVWFMPWLALLVVSLRDDMKSVAVGVRLAVHVLAALWFVANLPGSGTSATSIAWLAIAVLVTAWMLNLYNFMDGSDGLAVTMSLVGFAAYGAVLWWRDAPAALPLMLAATMVPMLCFNRPPARMFLGDVGAVPLGFLAAAFGLGGMVADVWAAWFPVLVFLPFVADATTTLARRVLLRERFWQSHRSHYYQRLHQLGAGHAGTLSAWGALMLGTAATAVACACLAPQWGPAALLAWCAVHAVVFATIDYHWRRSAHTT